MSIISFSWDKHFLYAIIYWILEIGVRLVMYLKWNEYFKMSESEVQNEYIYLILLTIADLLAIFLVLYVNSSFKKQQFKTQRTGSKSELIYKEQETVHQKNVIKRLIIICVCTYFSRSLYWISYAITGATNEDVPHYLQKDAVNTIDIVMRYIFSILILHIVAYRHRIISLGGIIAGLCIIVPADITLINSFENKKIRYNYSNVAILSLRGFSIPFEDTLIKILFSRNYLMPEKFMLCRGIIVGIIIVILTPILFFSCKVTLELIFNNKKIITVIIYTLASSVKSYFLLKIIYHFSSQSVSFLVISECVSGSIYQIINLINDVNKDELKIVLVILEIIGIIILAFAALLYDEIIIFKKWGLDKNVRKVIINRGEEDMRKTIELELSRESTLEENNLLDNEDNNFKENNQNNIVDNEVVENE
jgi:hypothetical protein